MAKRLTEGEARRLNLKLQWVVVFVAMVSVSMGPMRLPLDAADILLSIFAVAGMHVALLLFLRQVLARYLDHIRESNGSVDARHENEDR